MDRGDQLSDGYIRQLSRKGWLMIAAASAFTLGIFSGFKEVRDFAAEFGIPGWSLLAAALLIITCALHVAQYRLWKLLAAKLHAVTSAGNLLDKHDQDNIRWLRREVGGLIEIFNSGCNINDTDWRTIQAAPRAIRGLSAKLRHLGEISEKCQVLMEIVNRLEAWVDQGATRFDFVTMNAKDVALSGSDLIAECDRVLMLHRQASLPASRSSA